MAFEIGTQLDPLTAFDKYPTFDQQETIRQLKWPNISVFWSWGSHAFRTVKNRALRFRVQGHHHKGHVYIAMSCDLYIVILTTVAGRILSVTEGLYFDDLQSYIDEKVERIPAYKD